MEIEKQHCLERQISADCCRCSHSKSSIRGPLFWLLLIPSHIIFALFTLQSTRSLPISLYSAPSTSTTSPVYSPAENVLRYEVVVPKPNAWETSDYFQTPSEEIDTNWDYLFQVRGIYFSKDEAARLNMSSVQLKDGRQAVVIGTYHNLHCLRMLYQFVHRNHYFPNLTADDNAILVQHIYHCLEALRHSITCHPDLTAYSVRWEEDYMNLGVAANTNVPQTCAWDSLRAWMLTRNFGMDEMVLPGQEEENVQGVEGKGKVEEEALRKLWDTATH